MEGKPQAPRTPFGLEINCVALAGERPGFPRSCNYDLGKIPQPPCDSVSSSAPHALSAC